MLQRYFKLSILPIAMALPLCAEVNQSWEMLKQRLQPGQSVVVVQHGRSRLKVSWSP